MPSHSSGANNAEPSGTWWAWCVPALVAIAVYLPSLRNQFAYDDEVIVVTNTRIHHWSTLASALRIPYWYSSGHLYRPLTTLSLAIDWILGGGSPLPFHAANILWNALVVALVARLALQWWTPAAAFAAGLWFAIHPVHVEAVANVVGRSELICAAALLAVAIVAARATTTPGMATAAAPGSTGRPPANTGRLVVIGALSAAAMASKEIGIAAPVIVWAASWLACDAGRDTTRSDTERGIARRAVWRATTAASLGVVLILAVRLSILGGLAGDDPHPAFGALSASHAVLLALASLPRAVGLVLAPQLPRNDYSPSDMDLAHLDGALIVCGIALVAGAIAAVALHARRPGPWTFVIIFATATLAPVSNLVIHTGVVIAERTMYSPSAAYAIAMGVATAALWRHRARLPLTLAGGVAAIAVFFTETSIPAWHDTHAAVAAMRSRAPDSYRGYYLLAGQEAESGRTAAAHTDYRAAIGRFAHDPMLLYHGAINALRAGDSTTAARWLAGSIGADSNFVRARTALIMLEMHHGDTAAARTLLVDGLRLDPGERMWRTMLGKMPPAPPAPRAPALPGS